MSYARKKLSEKFYVRRERRERDCLGSNGLDSIHRIGSAAAAAVAVVVVFVAAVVVVVVVAVVVVDDVVATNQACWRITIFEAFVSSESFA